MPSLSLYSLQLYSFKALLYGWRCSDCDMCGVITSHISVASCLFTTTPFFLFACQGEWGESCSAGILKIHLSCDWRCFYLWGLFYSDDGLPQPKLARLRVYVAIEFSSFCHTRLLTANGCGVSSHHPFRSSCPHFSSLSIRSFLVNVFQSNSKRITTPAPQVPVLRRPRALRVLCMVSGTRSAF